MPRLSAGKRAEPKAYWRAHLDDWRLSKLNQRESGAFHGLPLKRFGNWRAKLKDAESAVSGTLLYRRCGGLRCMSGHMSSRNIALTSVSYVPSCGSTPPGGRRRFSKADRRRIVEEASQPVSAL